MLARKAMNAVFALALGMVMMVPGLRADAGDEETILTFSQSIQLPNHTILPAGTYRFMLADPGTQKQLVRVMDYDKKLITTIPTITTWKLQRDKDIVLKVSEPQGNEPVALMTWFYPDKQFGHQFVYSGPQGRTLEESTSTVMVKAEKPKGHHRVLVASNRY